MFGEQKAAPKTSLRVRRKPDQAARIDAVAGYLPEKTAETSREDERRLCQPTPCGRGGTRLSKLYAMLGSANSLRPRRNQHVRSPAGEEQCPVSCPRTAAGDQTEVPVFRSWENENGFPGTE
jgi:hypothetical protein